MEWDFWVAVALVPAASFLLYYWVFKRGADHMDGSIFGILVSRPRGRWNAESFRLWAFCCLIIVVVVAIIRIIVYLVDPAHISDWF